MNRGYRRSAIFEDDVDGQRFRGTLGGSDQERSMIHGESPTLRPYSKSRTWLGHIAPFDTESDTDADPDEITPGQPTSDSCIDIAVTPRQWRAELRFMDIRGTADARPREIPVVPLPVVGRISTIRRDQGCAATQPYRVQGCDAWIYVVSQSLRFLC